MEGWMEKKGEHLGAGWKRRYFRLEERKLLYYETAQQEARLKGEIDLSTGPTIRESDAHDDQDGPCEVQVVTSARTYRLRCIDVGEARTWTHSLRQAVAALAEPNPCAVSQHSVHDVGFRELLPHVPYRCKWSAAEPSGAQVWDSVAPVQVRDGAFVRPGEVIDATAVSYGESPKGAFLQFDRGYVQLSRMEPVEEMGVTEYYSRLGRHRGDRATNAAAAARVPSVKMQGLLLLAVRETARSSMEFHEVEDAKHYRLRGCRLEKMNVRRVGDATLQGHVCQVQACSGRSVDVELQNSVHRYWVTLTAPNATAAIEWTLALTAGRSPNNDTIPDGTKWLRDTAGFERAPAPNILDILSNPSTSTTGTRVDALYNQPHMRSVSLVIRFCDIAETGYGVLSSHSGQLVKASLSALRAPFPHRADKYAKLVDTEEAQVHISETSSGQRRGEVAFSVMPAVNTRWDTLRLTLISERGDLGAVHFTVAELNVAPGHELARIVEPPRGQDLTFFSWKTVDECDNELAQIDSSLNFVAHKLEQLRLPVQGSRNALGQDPVAPSAHVSDVVTLAIGRDSAAASQPVQITDVMLKLQRKADEGVDEETRRALLEQEKKQLETSKQSLEQCRAKLLEQEARQIECKITAFFHVEPAAGAFAQVVSVQRYLREICFVEESEQPNPDLPSVQRKALLATEQLLVPLSSLEVPIAFLEETIRYRRNELQMQHDALRNHIRSDNGLHRISAQMSADYWAAMLPLYEECLTFYKDEQASSQPPQALPDPMHQRASCAVDPHCWSRLLRYWLLQLREVPLFTGDLWVQQDRYDATVKSPPATWDELNQVIDAIGDENRIRVIRRLCEFLASPMFDAMGTRGTESGATYRRFVAVLFGATGRRRHHEPTAMQEEVEYMHAMVSLFRTRAGDSTVNSGSRTPGGSVTSSVEESPSHANQISATQRPSSGCTTPNSEVGDGWLSVSGGGPSLDGAVQAGRRMVVQDKEIEMEMVRSALCEARLIGPFFDMSLASLRQRDGDTTKFFDLCVHMIEKLGGPDADVFAHAAEEIEEKEIFLLKKCVDRYNEPISRAVLKPSSLKKNRLWGFVATNLCVQQMMMTTEPGNPVSSQGVPAFVGVTSGCAAAHTHGFERNDLINPPRGKCGIRRMEEKLEELRQEAASDPVTGPSYDESPEKDDWQLKQRGMNFLSGFKSKLHSVIWRLKGTDGANFTVHLFQHDENMSISLYTFTQDGCSSNTLVQSDRDWSNWYGDRSLEFPLSNHLPADMQHAGVKFDGYQWSLSVDGVNMNDWLSERQHAPNDNANEGFDIGRVQVTDGSVSDHGESKHVEYCVQVIRTDGSQLGEPLFKRYSDFEHLLKVINSAVHGDARLNLPTLPSKTFKIQFNRDFVERRAQALEEWCNRLNNVPRIATNPHFLIFFGLVAAPGDRTDQVTSPMAGTASPMAGMPSSRVLVGHDKAESSQQSLLSKTSSDVQSRHLDQKHTEIMGLSLRIEGRRDVALSQALSMLVTSLFATLQAAAALREPIGPSAEISPMCHQLRQNLRFIERMGCFCLSFESLLSTFGSECRMLEDLDAAVRLLNGVRLVCKRGQTGTRSRCDFIRRNERMGEFYTAWLAQSQSDNAEAADLATGTTSQLVYAQGMRVEPEPELQLEPEPEPGHASDDGIEDWCTIEVTLAPECFSIFGGTSTRPVPNPEHEPEPEPESGRELELDMKLSEGVPPAVHGQADTRTLSVRAVLFTQGVNEQQTMAARVGAKRDLGLQDEINRESVQTIRRIYTEYKHLADGVDPTNELEELDRKIDKLATAANRADGVNTKELDVLLTAASFARALGCARVTHCKSGKDRTSMSVTLEQCAVVEEELGRCKLACNPGESGDPTAAYDVLRDMMRTHGVRREGVRLNTETDVFAFNAAQRAALPAALQPPHGAYKSMLRGGPAS